MNLEMKENKVIALLGVFAVAFLTSYTSSSFARTMLGASRGTSVETVIINPATVSLAAESPSASH